MLDLDLTQEIAALRSTFRDIRAVVDVDALEAEIARLSEQAGAPDLWADTEKAQMEITPVPGDRVQALVKEIYATPPEIAQKATSYLR